MCKEDQTAYDETKPMLEDVARAVYHHRVLRLAQRISGFQRILIDVDKSGHRNRDDVLATPVYEGISMSTVNKATHC
jgi:hypothetical protein